jgi:hypothetical protein
MVSEMSPQQKAVAARKSAHQEHVWDEVKAHPDFDRCKCKIHKGMDWEELYTVKSCASGWVCPVLDKYRRLTKV